MPIALQSRVVLLLVCAVCLVAVAAITTSVWLRSRERSQIIRQVEGLNGGVGKRGVEEIHFLVAGLKPLIDDHELMELAPALGRHPVTSVDFEGTPISDQGFEALIADCHQTLEDVVVCRSSISAAGVASLSRCSKLRRVVLSYDTLDNNVILALKKCEFLREIWVTDAPADGTWVSNLATSLPEVRVRTRKLDNLDGEQRE